VLRVRRPRRNPAGPPLKRTPGAPALAFAFLAACASAPYERASTTADTTAEYREHIVQLASEVRLAGDGLRALRDNPGDSPRSNRETFETFARELENLESSVERSREIFERMDGRAASYFGGWSEDSARIIDANLKKSGDSRRSALRANYERLEAGQESLDRELEGYVGRLADLRIYLAHDLTAAGIASARSTIDHALAQAVALRERLREQVRLTDEARDALAPPGEAAPARTEASLRVR